MSAAKRLFDLAVSCVALVILSPLLAVVWLLVRLRIGKPAIFRQARPGFGGRTFQILKFRTMDDARDQSGALLPDDERLTPLGVFLRSTSLDELPTLINIIRGEMSLVGPRPLLPEYLSLYSPRQARRHEVRPGLTGWAQVNGRNALSWEDKFELDVWYVDHRSFVLDLRIILLTIGKVLRREDISAANAATMPRFTGSPPGLDRGASSAGTQVRPRPPA